MLGLVLLTVSALSLPASVRGDFDRDGKPDIARVEKVGKTYAVVVRSSGHRYVIEPVRASDLRSLYLDKARAGRWRTWCGKGGDIGDGVPCRTKSVRIRGDVLAFGTKESSEAVAIWTGKGFDVIWLSD